MLVREVMTTPAVTVTAETSVRAAVRLLDEHKITSMPVLDRRGRLVGVVSEADLVREVLRPDPRTRMLPPDRAGTPAASRVEDVMSTLPVTVHPDDDLAGAVDLLTSTAVKSVPVIAGDAVVGVLSRRDVVHLLARTDDRIEAEVVELFRSDGVDWLADVEDGTVLVTGPASEAERRLATALAGSVAGVVAVRVE